jgi:hypothetical protein
MESLVACAPAFPIEKTNNMMNRIFLKTFSS